MAHARAAVRRAAQGYDPIGEHGETMVKAAVRAEVDRQVEKMAVPVCDRIDAEVAQLRRDVLRFLANETSNPALAWHVRAELAALGEAD
jgi:hypothetical protein